MIALNLAAVIGLAVNYVIPLLVGLLTKQSTHPGIKAVILLLLTAANALFTQFLSAMHDGHGFAWGIASLQALLGFAVAVAGHFGLFKPTGAADAVATRGNADAPDTAAPAGVLPADPAAPDTAAPAGVLPPDPAKPAL